MIPNSVEDILEKQERTQRKHRTLTASAIGAGLAVAVSMFALKHDINKTYFDLSKRIDRVEAQVGNPPYSGQTATRDSIVIVPPPPVHIHVHQGYNIVESCVTPSNGVYEVRPC